MAFFDRLLGEIIFMLPENSDEGRFVDLENHQIILLQNGKLYLPNSKWHDDKLTEFDCVTRAVKLIAQNYRKNIGRSPLMPPELAEQAIFLDLENELAKVLAKGHLQAIAYRPRLDMHYQNDVVPLPRAKRLAKSALTHLSSHSDCWQRRTIKGILPKKILAEFSEDYYEIYENRLYKCLLDRLENHLTRRLNWLLYLKRNLENFLIFQNSEEIDFRLRNRICALWGENYQSGDINIQLDGSQVAIETIKKQLKIIMGLKQTGLYAKMPIYTYIPNQLRRTNILNHDEHYQHLPKLWDRLNLFQQDNLTPEQEKQWAINLQSDYEEYIKLLLERAFEDYHYNKEDQSFVFAEMTYFIKKENHCFVIYNDENNILLTIIPIANQIDIENVQIPKNKILCSLFSQNNMLLISPMDLYVLEKIKNEINIYLYQILKNNYNQEIKPVPSQIIKFSEEYPQIFKLSAKNGVKIIHPVPISLRDNLEDILDKYCNQETYLKFKKQMDNLEQIQDLCNCENPVVKFQPHSAGLYGKCQNCKWEFNF